MNLPIALQQQARLLGGGNLTAGVERAIAIAHAASNFIFIDAPTMKMKANIEVKLIEPKNDLRFGDLAEGDWFVFRASLPCAELRLKTAECESIVVGQHSPDKADLSWAVLYARVGELRCD